MIAKVQSYVADLNANITSLEGKHGPVSKYNLPKENWTGKLEITFEKQYFEGIACSLDSVGYKYVIQLQTTVSIGNVLFSTSAFCEQVAVCRRCQGAR